MEKRSKKTKKNSNGALWIIIIMAILIVLAIIFTQNRGNQKTKSTSVSDGSNTVTENYIQEIENGVKLNTSAKLNEAKEVGGYKFTNIQLTTKSGITTILMNVTNISGSSTELKNVKVTLLDKDGNELTTLKGVIVALENNNSTELNIAATSDYVDAYDITISID